LYIFIYENKQTMKMTTSTKLTTVKIIKNVYSQFKQASFDSDITLQKLVNRSLARYIDDKDFRDEIKECVDLEDSGSQF
jgi:hypothetical protein